MKIRIDAEMLRDELSRATSVIEKTPRKPGLEYVLVEPAGKYVKFTGSDGVAAIESFAPSDEVEFEAGAKGPICLPGRKTLDLVKLMSGEVRFETLPNGYINLYNGRSKYRLASIDASRYPRIAEEFTPSGDLPAQVLRRAIKLTRGFIGEDDSKFAFSGGLLEVSDGSMRVVATDGARLAVAECGGVDEGDFSVLLPHRSLNMLAGLISRDSETVTVAFARNPVTGAITKAKFKIERAFLTTNLTTGQFPAWRQILPSSDHELQAELSRTELHNALRKALVATDGKSNIVELNFAPGSVLVKTDGADAGSDVLDAEYLTGDPAEDAEARLGLNANFVNQFLAVVPDVLEDDSVLISYNGPTQFVGISPREAEFDFKYLLAPARL
ncbi:MAG: DNA polymerase III subunit beta [Pyrinomonadaceae bacterium]